MPFQISPDPRFLWLGEKHKEALAVLKYGVLNNQGFLLLTGDVGTGKTTLINALVKSLGPTTFFVNVVDPHLDKPDFFNLIARSFKLEAKLITKLDFLLAFKDFLCRAHDLNLNVVLIIDEAQKLSLDLLEEIRLLSNIEREDTKLISVFFVGQNEFNDTLLRPECRALRQRITIVHNIETLNEMETAQYVKYRLGVAGAQREIFTDQALKKIYAFSRGYPRLINIICDRALLAGYSEDLQTIDHKIIHECTRNVSLPGEKWELKSLTRLDELAGYMLQKTDFDITIRGYSDAFGSSEYNKNLSALRANLVKRYLVGKGINPNRIRAIGMGDAAPRTANNASEGIAANRRAVIELVVHKP
jgi:general secretion pathway protein A